MLFFRRCSRCGAGPFLCRSDRLRHEADHLDENDPLKQIEYRIARLESRLDKAIGGKQ